MFNRLKNWWRIVTRNDKTAHSHLGSIALAFLWIKFVHGR